MNMSELEDLVMTGADHETVSLRYAIGFGRLLALLSIEVDRMNPEDKAKFKERLERRAKFWSESQKKVEESTTCQ